MHKSFRAPSRRSRRCAARAPEQHQEDIILRLSTFRERRNSIVVSIIIKEVILDQVSDFVLRQFRGIRIAKVMALQTRIFCCDYT